MPLKLKPKARWHAISKRSRWASSATHILGHQRHGEVGWPVPFLAAFRLLVMDQ